MNIMRKGVSAYQASKNAYQVLGVDVGCKIGLALLRTACVVDDDGLHARASYSALGHAQHACMQLLAAVTKVDGPYLRSLQLDSQFGAFPDP